MKKVLAAGLATALVATLALLSFQFLGARNSASAVFPPPPQGPIVLAIDMDPYSAPANSCPGNGIDDCTVGSIEQCVSVPATEGTTFDIDVLVTALWNGHSGWNWDLAFPDTASGAKLTMTVQVETAPLVNLIAQSAGSAPVSLSEAVPDATWPHSGAAGEAGSSETTPPWTQGVLSRMTFQVGEGATPGLYGFSFVPGTYGVFDQSGTAYPAVTTLDHNSTLRYGILALGVDCPPLADIKLVGFDFVNPPPAIPPGQDVGISTKAIIHNNGPFDPADVSVTVSAAVPPQCVAVPVSASQIISAPVGLDVLSEQQFTIRCDQPPAGTFVFSAQTQPADSHVIDPDPTNNVALLERRVMPFVRLNEVSFDPLGDDVGEEWVEVINRGLVPVNLADWTVTNRDATPVATLPPLTLPPNALLVVHFGVGTNDLDLSDDEGHFYTGSAVEVFDNEEDEVALFAEAPSSRTIVDFFVYSFLDYTPGLAHDLAVQAGIWTAGEFFPGVPLDEGSSLGRDSLSKDMDLPSDWYGDGGVEADGPTPGRINLDPLSAAHLGVATDAERPTETPALQDADAKKYRDLLKEVLKQICDQHRGLFGQEFLDEGFKEWCDDANRGFEEGTGAITIDNKEYKGPAVKIDNIVFVLHGINEFGGLAKWPDTPDGVGGVVIDWKELNDKKWAWKEAVLHELVHVATFRKLNLGGWNKDIYGKTVPADAKQRSQVLPCHEVYAYITDLKLKQELIKGLPTKEDAKAAKENAKTPEEKKKAAEVEKNAKTREEIEKLLKRHVEKLDDYLGLPHKGYAGKCLENLREWRQCGAADPTSPWHRFGKHLDELLKKVRDKIMEKKTSMALSKGISKEELASLTELWYGLFDPEKKTKKEDVKKKIQELKTRIEEEAEDTDGDRLPDIDEGAFGTDPHNPDSDGDGLSDGIEAAILGPGTNPLNPDTDGDSVPDGTEVDKGCDPLDPMSTLESVDVGGTCSDGRDNDLDGLTDSADPGCMPFDSDDDAVPDATDNCPFDANPDQADTDGDGLGDECDEDDDNDTFGDEFETVLGSDPLSAASTPEHFSVPTACTDGLDNDLDGLFDAADEGCIPLRDSDDDGLSDAVDNCLDVANHDQADLQKDGVGDTCDSDDDNDGFEDVLDLCPASTEDFDGFQDTDGCPDPDNDADGVSDDADNCPDTANADQADQDTDGIGDVCDLVPANPDADGDGAVDGQDNCPLVPNADQQDVDDDGFGDVCDDDEDSDDVLSALDNCRLIYNRGQDDTDLDGLGDDCDGDDDGDGLGDSIDNCPDTPNADQANTDGDRQGDACDWDDDNDTVDDPSDNCPRAPNSRQVDTDGDGLGDACDSDGDNDGFTDEQEIYVGTDPMDARSNPLDIDGDGVISVTGDVINYVGRIGATPNDPDWWQRLDFDMSGDITVTGDVFMYVGRIGETCG